MAKKAWRLVGWTSLVLAAVLAYAGYRTVWGTPFTLNMLANRQALLFLTRSPELFTEVGLIDGTLLDHHSDKLDPVTVEKRDADFAQAARFLDELHGFDRASLGRQDQITYDILLEQWSNVVAFRKFPWISSVGLYPLDPMGGVESAVPQFMESVHVVRNERSAANYVKRLIAMGPKLDQATAMAQWQATQGLVMPPALIDSSLKVIHDTIAEPPEKSALVTTFTAKLEKVADLDAARRQALTQQAVDAVRSQVYPAYERMAAFLEAQKPAAAHRGAGVGDLTDGAAYYALVLKQMTTTDYTPGQVHALGLKEVERISGEMDTLLRSQGRSEGTVAERMQALAKDPRYLLPNTDAGRKEILDRYQQLLDEVDAKMSQYFHALPKDRLKVERVPEAQQAGAPGAFYMPPAMDGSRPGRFFVNLRDLSENPTWGMKTLAYHEGIPGHHFQGSIALGLKDLPMIRQQTLYTAYAEGWGLYAERLGDEIGMYANDPLGRLGRLQLELLRAVRLVVDTGLHAEGWTRERAIDYMVDTTGLGRAEVTTEVERYMADPGQACAYKIGELKIVELREKAKAALGPKFDIRDFHAVVLENGGVPLTVLEQLVDEYIARKRGS